MSVIGLDFGNDSCYIAVARQGGIETIANDYSLRATSSCVAFGEKTRILGVAAKNQMITNMKNTCVNFKRLIGKKYRQAKSYADDGIFLWIKSPDKLSCFESVISNITRNVNLNIQVFIDPRIKNELKSLQYKVIEEKDGTLGIKVQYLNEEHTFSSTQLTAMLFTKLKHIAEIALNIKVVDVVIGVPFYFDDAIRHAVLEAAAAAGLNVLRLMNETTAVALAYGIYKQDLPAAEEKPRNVVFVDCGHSNIQVSAAAFNKGKLKMLAAVGDENVGGRDFDLLLAEHVAKEFKTKYKIDAKSNPRPWTRLLSEVEKLKKQMSANSTELPINIECFMNDKDVSARLKRTDMEEMASGILKKIETALANGLADSSLRVDDIYSVELIGGLSRMPAIKQLIEKVFKKVPSTTLNADEAVARGCALQCAMLSPTFKVREFSVTDIQPYSIQLIWSDESGREADMEVFPRNHQVPFSKMLTFFRRDPFSVQAKYSHPSPSPDPVIGHFTIQDVNPTSEGESQKVKVKVRVNLHGLFTVASASLTEKKEVTEESEPNMESDEKAEKDQESPATDKENMNHSNEVNDEQKMDTENKEPEAQNGNAKDSEKKPKKLTKTVDLPVTASVHNLSREQLHSIVELESKMVQDDKMENDRINAKNAVEEYVYEMRSKISDELEKFIEPSDQSKFRDLLEDTENWLYEDGEDCAKNIYMDKLSQLRKVGEPVQKRKREREEIPLAMESLMTSVQLALKSVQSFRGGDAKYDHLDAAEVEKVDKAIGEKQAWVDRNMGAISSTPLTKDVPTTAQQIRSEKSLFDALVNPIMNKSKPKPKVKDPPPAESESKDKKAEGNDAASETNPEPKPTEPMDVD